MGYDSAFKIMAKLSEDKNIICILIGGFAVNFYKVTRMTADVDFLIAEDDYPKILEALRQAGYKEDYIQEQVFVRFRNEDKMYLDLDLMFTDKNTLTKIYNESKKISIAGQELIIPSLNNLIALKLHSIKHNPENRTNKDLPDIINLIRSNNIDYRNDEFKKLCLKYGTSEIYEHIIASFRV